MSAKNKDTIGCIALTLIIIAAVIIGGYYERGYFAVASEIVLVPFLALWIIERRLTWEK